MFDLIRFVVDLWVTCVMAGLIWFWLRDVDWRRWQEWVLSSIAIPPVALTLWRALADIGALASIWVTGV